MTIPYSVFKRHAESRALIMIPAYTNRLWQTTTMEAGAGAENARIDTTSTFSSMSKMYLRGNPLGEEHRLYLHRSLASPSVLRPTAVLRERGAISARLADICSTNPPICANISQPVRSKARYMYYRATVQLTKWIL